MSEETRRALLRDRRKGLGGTDMPAIFGLVPYRNSLDVYYSMTRPPEEEGEPGIDILRGRELEPKAIEWLWKHTGWRGRTRTTAATHPDYPAFRCHPDADIFSDPHREPSNPDEWENPDAIKETGTAEIKCPRGWIFTRVYEEGLRQAEVVQLQTYLAVERRPWGAFGYASFEHSAGPILPIEVEADEELGQFILEAGQRFMDEHITPRIPPDPAEWQILADPDAPSIKVTKGELVEIDDDAVVEMGRGVIAAKNLKKKGEDLYKERKQAMEAWMMEHLEETHRIRVPGVGKFTLVTNDGRESFSKDALAGHRPIDRDALIRFVTEEGVDRLEQATTPEALDEVLTDLELDLEDFTRRGDGYMYLLPTEE